MSLSELKERLAYITCSVTKYSGLLCGLAAVGYADPVFLQNLFPNIAANCIWQILDTKSPPPKQEKVMAELDREEIIQGLCRALTEKGLDRQVIAALGQLPSEQAEPVWQAYTADTGRLKDTTIRTSAAYGSLREILTRPRFMVAVMPSHLNRLLGGFMPHQLVERPELEPLTRALFDGCLRQAAMKWLGEPNQGRAVAYLGYPPSAEDAAPLNALDPEKHLVIIDPVSPEPLEDKETANIIGLGCRTILCQRIGQSQYQKQVKGLVSFLEAPGGGNYNRWNIAANDSPSPAWDRVYFHLGPMPKQTVISLLDKSREVLDRQAKLTLLPEGKEAIFEALQALSGRDETTLLGLAKALLLFAIQKAGKDRLILDRRTVTELLDEIGLSLTGPTAEEEWERIVENLFGGIVTDEEKNVLRVMKNWRWFTQSAVLPLQALYAGYSCLTNDCDLRTADFHLLERLEATRIITRDNEEETVRVWHPLQLEAIRDGLDYSARYAWMQKSLNKLRELAFPPDESMATQAGRVRSLSEFCKCLLDGRITEKEIGNLLKDALGVCRELAKEKPKDYLPGVAAIATNLGILFKNLGEPQEAVALLEVAYASYQRLLIMDFHTFLPDLANIAHNLGTFYGELGSHGKAKNLLRKALKIRRSLAATVSGAYLADVAATAGNLGNLFKDQKEYLKARLSYEAALRIRRELVDEYFTDANRSGVAETLNNYGNLFQVLRQYEKARILLEESLEIRKRLVDKNSRGYERLYAETANNIGVLFSEIGDHNRAWEMFSIALEIRRRLAQTNTRAFQPDLAGTLSNLADLFLSKEEYVTAAPFVAEAVVLYAVLVPTSPVFFGPRFVRGIKFAQRLYRADEFRSERDYWLLALQTTIVEQVGPEGIESLISLITMTDEELDMLRNQPE